MRSIWKGHIRFSLVTIPVQIYNGLEAETTLSFKQLHDKDNGKIQYKKVCSACQEEVPMANIIKGYEYEPERFVIFKKDELDNVKLPSTKIIDIDAFVDIAEVHPSRYESLYFVGPNGDIANPTYNLLKKALLASGKAGVGKVVIREREDVVLLVPEKDGIIMYKLRYPNEVRNVAQTPDVKDTPIDDAQLNLANTLINSLAKPFSDIKFEDKYHSAVMSMVQEKVSGKQVFSVETPEESAPVVDIMEALKRSIEEAKLKKGA
jgi:DNA end-binding protein Ku